MSGQAWPGEIALIGPFVLLHRPVPSCTVPTREPQPWALTQSTPGEGPSPPLSGWDPAVRGSANLFYKTLSFRDLPTAFGCAVPS